MKPVAIIDIPSVEAMEELQKFLLSEGIYWGSGDRFTKYTGSTHLRIVDDTIGGVHINVARPTDTDCVVDYWEFRGQYMCKDLTSATYAALGESE